MNTPLPGALRPYTPTSTRYIDALVVVESCGIILEQIVTGKLPLTAFYQRTLAGSLRQAADLIDGGHHA